MGLDKFSAALDLLKGFNVNLYVGEDVVKGKLIGVETDHVVLEADNKYIYYYNIDKIHAITKNTRLFQPEKPKMNFQKTQSLRDLLHSFQHSWVTILSINKQKFTGVLSEIDEDFATLINGEERILIKLIHISNILKGFIKEAESKSKETKSKDTKSKESKEEGQNKNDSKKNEKEKDKDKEKDTKEKDTKEKDTKEKDTVYCETKEYTAERMPESYSKPVAKATSASSEKKAKASSRHEKVEKEKEVFAAVEVIEPNTTMVWSQSIKTESPVIKVDQHTSKGKTHQSVGEKNEKAKKEMKKPNNEMKQKEKKIEEPILSKPKHVEQTKEKRHVEKTKETKQVEQTKETKQVKDTPVKMETKATQNKEVKISKSNTTAPTSNLVFSHTAAPKKTENAANDNSENDTKSVWKQKEQEKRAIRFTGEPVSRNTERAFPFAGWPTTNKTKRTFRF